MRRVGSPAQLVQPEHLGCSLYYGSGLCTVVRGISTGVFDHPPFKYRQRHSFNTLPVHDANRFGGRSAYLREIGPIDHKKKGRLFKRDPRTVQYNVDIWCAQQTLRRQWKGRDWEVVELPFEAAPPVLQRVLPEKYTDVPIMADPSAGDCMNIRRKVFDREELQETLYGSTAGGALPYPAIQKVNKMAMTLNKFL